MGHPEYAVPVYLGILLFLLLFWLTVPVLFLTLLWLKFRVEMRDCEWLEEETLLSEEDEVQREYHTFAQGWKDIG